MMYCLDFYKNFFTAPEDKVHLFFLIDGLGMNIIEGLGDDNWFVKNLQGEMRSVFPSTTAVALPVIGSLKQPGQLGVTGWTTWLPGSQRLSNVLTGERGDTKEKDDTLIDESFVVPSAMARPDAITINPMPYITQRFNAWTTEGKATSLGYRYGDDWDSHADEDHWSDVLLKAASEAKPGTFIYTYLPMVDSMSHKTGWDSSETLAVVQSIQNEMRNLESALAALPGNYSIAATADHGLINTEQDKYFIITPDTSWMKFLETQPTGEGRNPVFHVKEGQEQAFVKAFEASQESQYFTLKTPEEMVEEGFFPEGISEAARERWGTYIGLAAGQAYMEFVYPGKKSIGFKGVHGGNHEHERRVPLIRSEV